MNLKKKMLKPLLFPRCLTSLNMFFNFFFLERRLVSFENAGAFSFNGKLLC